MSVYCLYLCLAIANRSTEIVLLISGASYVYREGCFEDDGPPPHSPRKANNKQLFICLPNYTLILLSSYLSICREKGM